MAASGRAFASRTTPAGAASKPFFAAAAAPGANALRSGFTGLPAAQLRSFAALADKREKVKVLLVLYDGGQHAKDVPELLGTTENELGLRKWLEDQGMLGGCKPSIGWA